MVGEDIVDEPMAILDVMASARPIYLHTPPHARMSAHLSSNSPFLEWVGGEVRRAHLSSTTMVPASSPKLYNRRASPWVLLLCSIDAEFR